MTDTNTDQSPAEKEVAAQNAEAAAANPTQPPAGAQAATGDSAGTSQPAAANTSAAGAATEDYKLSHLESEFREWIATANADAKKILEWISAKI